MPRKKVVRINPRQAELLAEPDDAMWTREEVAIVLSVKPRTVYGIAGLVAVRMLGRGRRKIVRYRAGDVRRFLRECRACA